MGSCPLDNFGKNNRNMIAVKTRKNKGFMCMRRLKIRFANALNNAKKFPAPCAVKLSLHDMKSLNMLMPLVYINIPYFAFDATSFCLLR